MNWIFLKKICLSNGFSTCCRYYPEALHLAAEALLLTASAAAAAEDALAAVDNASKVIAAAATPEAGKEACVFGISLAAKALADLLRTRRFYFDPEDGGGGGGGSSSAVDFGGGARRFDPRMLVFEYAQSIVLRERQVGLVRDFTAAANGGGWVAPLTHFTSLVSSQDF